MYANFKIATTASQLKDRFRSVIKFLIAINILTR